MHSNLFVVVMLLVFLPVELFELLVRIDFFAYHITNDIARLPLVFLHEELELRVVWIYGAGLFKKFTALRVLAIGKVKECKAIWR